MKGELVILTNIQGLFTIIPFAGILTFILYIIKKIVNSVTAHELDRLFSTPWNKFVEMSIAISLFSFSFFVFITTEVFKIELVEFINAPKQGLIFSIILLTIIIWGSFSLMMLGKEIYKTLCKQNVYYVIGTDDEPWKIEKSVSDGKLYVSYGNKKKIMIVDDNTIFENYTELSEIGIKFYSKIRSKKLLLSIVVFLFLLLLIILYVTFEINKVLLVLIVPLTFYLMILIMIFKIGYDDYLEFRGTARQQEEGNNETHAH